MAREMAVKEERNRLAQEIHDTLAQAFLGIIFLADPRGFPSEGNDPQSRKAIERIQELARCGLEEARRVVGALRPRALECSTLSEALREEAHSLSSDYHLPCEFRQLGSAWKLPARVEDELFRIAQEAMNNVQKHARASLASVNLEFKTGQVVLTVRDNGMGFSAADFPGHRSGHGLKIMRERAQRIGARLEIETGVGGGTVIRVLVPPVKSGEQTHQSS